MDNGAKIISVILSVLAVMLLGIYVFLSAVNKQIPRPVEYPVSNMSQSIFEAQNTKYSPNSSLTDRHSFTHSPYTIDIMPSDAAKVSDTGYVYKLSDTMYFYVTEFQTGTNIDSVIRNELPKAVMIDSNVDMTAIDKYTYEEGYLNGFKGDYYIDCMTVTNGTRTASVYITGYALTITDSVLDHGHKMFLAVMTTQNDTAVFANGKSMLDTVVQTYQVDYDIQNRLLQEEEAFRQEEERKKEQAIENGETYIPPTQTPQDNLVVSSDENTTSDMAANAGIAYTDGGQQAAGTQVSEYIRQDSIIGIENSNAGIDAGAAADASIPQKKTKSMTLEQDYSSVTLYYYYDNTDEDIEVTLESPDGVSTYTPQSSVPGTIVFKVDTMEAGKWRLYINGNPGSDSMKLYSESMETAEQE